MAIAREVHIEVERRYEKMREDRNKLYSERRELVYMKIPEVEIVDSQLSQLGLSMLDKVIKGELDADDVETELDREASKLLEKREQLYKENHIPLDFLDPPYNCEICKDRGYIAQQPCECFNRNLVECASHSANLSEWLKNQTFDNFKLEIFSDKAKGNWPMSPRQNMLENMQLCKKLVGSFDTAMRNLLFYGESGTGKTFLSSCIAHAVLELKKSVIYFSADDVFAAFENVKFSRDPSQEAQNFCESILSCDLLVIDDLGTELPTAFTSNVLFRIVNSRILQNKKTIINTNLELADIRERYTERVFSRIKGHYDYFKFFGDDIR